MSGVTGPLPQEREEEKEKRREERGEEKEKEKRRRGGYVVLVSIRHLRAVQAAPRSGRKI